MRSNNVDLSWCGCVFVRIATETNSRGSRLEYDSMCGCMWAFARNADHGPSTDAPIASMSATSKNREWVGTATLFPISDWVMVQIHPSSEVWMQGISQYFWFISFNFICSNVYRVYGFCSCFLLRISYDLNGIFIIRQCVSECWLPLPFCCGRPSIYKPQSKLSPHSLYRESCFWIFCWHASM